MSRCRTEGLYRPLSPQVELGDPKFPMLHQRGLLNRDPLFLRR